MRTRICDSIPCEYIFGSDIESKIENFRWMIQKMSHFVSISVTSLCFLLFFFFCQLWDEIKWKMVSPSQYEVKTCISCSNQIIVVLFLVQNHLVSNYLQHRFNRAANIDMYHCTITLVNIWKNPVFFPFIWCSSLIDSRMIYVILYQLNWNKLLHNYWSLIVPMSIWIHFFRKSALFK